MCTHLLINPDRMLKSRSVWPTLWVKMSAISNVLLVPAKWLVGKIISEMTCNVSSGMFKLHSYLVTISGTVDSHGFVNIWEVYHLIAGNRQTNRLIDLSVMIDWKSWYHLIDAWVSAMYTVFQKKTPTHTVAYKLRNSCLILIIFDTKIPDISWHRTTA